MADRGEWEGYSATDFVAKSTVTVEIAAPYRGDQKGTTEKKFDQFHRLLRTRLDGMIEKKVIEKGDADYRRDAILNLNEITNCVIEVVIFLNNHNYLKGYPLSREMLADQVVPVPVDIWRWCRDRGMSELSRTSPEQVEFALLPTSTASVTSKGYRYNDLYYKPVDFRRSKVFDRARQNGVSQAPISYDPLRTTNIYLHDSDAPCGFVLLELTDRSAAYADVSFKEASELKKAEAKRIASREADYVEGYARMSRSLERANGLAKRERPRKLKSSELQGSKEARHAERNMERQGRLSSLPATSPTQTSNITSISDALRGRASPPPERTLDDDMADYLG